MAEGFKEEIKAATLLGISYELLTVWIGGMLGIITMRYVAGMFIALLDKMPGLASAAYQLILWIGIKLLASGVDQAFHLATADRATGWRSHLPKSLLDMHFEISETLFWTVMASIIVVAVLRSLSKKSRLDPEFVETMRDLNKMDQSIDEAASDAVDSIGDAMKPEG